MKKKTNYKGRKKKKQNRLQKVLTWEDTEIFRDEKELERQKKIKNNTATTTARVK